jgi:hypothetical protein
MKLQMHSLCCQGSKCQFKKEKVDFLGMTISEGSIQVSEEKIVVIKGEKVPTTKKGVQHFLGMTNYHQCFIKGYLD